MNKKALVGMGLVAAMLIVNGISYAEELNETLKIYLNDHSPDFLGIGYDKILFESNLSLLEDIKTIPLQLRCIHKIVTQKANIIAYGSLGGIYGTKIAVGATEFNSMLMQLLKLATKF